MKGAIMMAAALAVAGCVQAEVVPGPSGQAVDLSNLDPQQRGWIEASCSHTRDLGPSSYYPCIQDNLIALQSERQR